MMFRFYFVKQINGDRAENVAGDRQDRETGTGDRRTRIQRGETGNVVGDRQDREAGTEDRQTRISRIAPDTQRVLNGLREGDTTVEGKEARTPADGSINMGISGQ
ncbi:unnamed protein product [Boreogadus saida]